MARATGANLCNLSLNAMYLNIGTSGTGSHSACSICDLQPRLSYLDPQSSVCSIAVPVLDPSPQGGQTPIEAAAMIQVVLRPQSLKGRVEVFKIERRRQWIVFSLARNLTVGFALSQLPRKPQPNGFHMLLVHATLEDKHHHSVALSPKPLTVNPKP